MEIAKVIFQMAEVLRDKITETLVDGWVDLLASENVTVEEAKRAAREVLKSREYNKLPPPAVFLEIIRPKVDVKQIANAQADFVLESVNRCGPDRKPEFKDPITAELMSKRWPWYGFAAGLETSAKEWWRKDFIEAYCGEQKMQRLLDKAEPFGILEEPK